MEEVADFNWFEPRPVAGDNYLRLARLNRNVRKCAKLSTIAAPNLAKFPHS
jgi:hypothetical protein